MKQFEIEGKIFNLKNSWEDLLFSDWMNFLKIEQQKELLGQEEDYVIKVLTILTDCTELDILNAPLSLLNELMASLDYMNTPVPKIENKFIMINGEKWAFKKDFNKLTMGEYISIKTFQENSKDELSTTCLVLSVLLRKVIEEKESGELVLDMFRPDDCQKISNLLMKEAKMCDVYHYLNFFFALNNQYTLIGTEAYSVIVGLKAQELENTK